MGWHFRSTLVAKCLVSCENNWTSCKNHLSGLSGIVVGYCRLLVGYCRLLVGHCRFRKKCIFHCLFVFQKLKFSWHLAQKQVRQHLFLTSNEERSQTIGVSPLLPFSQNVALGKMLIHYLLWHDGNCKSVNFIQHADLSRNAAVTQETLFQVKMYLLAKRQKFDPCPKSQLYHLFLLMICLSWFWRKTCGTLTTSASTVVRVTLRGAVSQLNPQKWGWNWWKGGISMMCHTLLMWTHHAHDKCVKVVVHTQGSGIM